MESFVIHNGFPSGAARVRLYAWAKPHWLRISLNELQTGERVVTRRGHPRYALHSFMTSCLTVMQ